MSVSVIFSIFLLISLLSSSVLSATTPPIYGWGSIANSNVPQELNSISNDNSLNGRSIVSIHAGEDFALVQTPGKLFAWGANTFGQLGDGTFNSSAVAVEVHMNGSLAGQSIDQVSTGGLFTLVLDGAGNLHSWGCNEKGQLGIGSNLDSNVPVAVNMSGVLNGLTIEAIAAGNEHAFVLANANLFTWGDGSDGQLGNGFDLDSNVPVAVNMSGVLDGKTIVKIAAGNDFNLVLTFSNHLIAWGDGSDGQLGNGFDLNSNVPVFVNMSGVLNGLTINTIKAGDAHCLVLSSANKLFAWGENTFGQLGDGTNVTSNVPVAVGGELATKDILMFSAGNSHSLAMTVSGIMYAWGDNSAGQLGNGSTYSSSSLPILVDLLSMGSPDSFVASADGDFCLALSQGSLQSSSSFSSSLSSSSGSSNSSSSESSSNSGSESNDATQIVLSFVALFSFACILM